MSEARVLHDAPWLKSGPAARVLQLLNSNGEEARVVGGAVRNALLKIPTGDIDIATTALPDEVVRRAKAAGIKSVPTGIDHGTVTLVVDAQAFEVTTLREDTKTFGRKAKVAFGRDWVRDAERRDFTINALSVDADGGLLQAIVGGIAYTGPFIAMIAAERLLGLEPDAVRRLGALAVAVTEDAKRVATRLRLANAETKALDSMGHRWWRLAGMDEKTARRRLYRLGPQRYRDRVQLAWAPAGSHTDAARWQELATLPERWSAPKFPLKAADFIARGIAEGPALGHVLTLAEDAWLAADFPLDEAALKTIADQTITRFTRDHRL